MTLRSKDRVGGSVVLTIDRPEVPYPLSPGAGPGRRSSGERTRAAPHPHGPATDETRAANAP